MREDERHDARTTRMDVDTGDITGYEGSDQVVGRPEGSDLGGPERAEMGRPDMRLQDEMPKEGVPEASPSVPNDALAEPRH
jgi:hypothetical protein